MRDAEIKEIPTSLLMEVGGDMEEKQESIIPNRSIDRKSVTSNGKDYFLLSFIFCWHLVSCLFSTYPATPSNQRKTNSSTIK